MFVDEKTDFNFTFTVSSFYSIPINSEFQLLTTTDRVTSGTFPYYERYDLGASVKYYEDEEKYLHGQTLGKYMCPKGFEREIAKQMQIWTAVAIGLVVCIIVTGIVMFTTYNWDKKYGNMDA